MPGVEGRQYRIGDFLIDTGQYRISTAGAAVPVEPKVFDLLAYLVRNRGRVVTREELFETVWEGRPVSDATLSNHVMSARKVLGDNGELQQTILTIRGRGYQFIAPVSEVAVDAPDPAVAKPPSPVQERARWPGRPAWTLSVAVVLLLAVAATMSGLRWTGSDGAAERIEEPWLVVIPLDVYRAEPEVWQPWADDLTRRLINSLQQISGLRTLERATSFEFSQDKTLKHIHEELPDVRYALGGMLDFPADRKPIVTMELHDLLTGKLIWTRSYPYPRTADGEGRAQLQLIIIRAVSEELRVKILKDENRALEKAGARSTKNAEAWSLYLEGWKYLLLPDHKSLNKAVVLFDQAIRLDAGFYDAHVAKGTALRWIYAYYETPRDVFPRVVEAFEVARKLRPEAVEPLSQLGLTYAMAWRWVEAWEYLDAARNKSPALATTELGLAIYYSGLGAPELVKQSLDRAERIDPLNLEIADWGNWALFLGGNVADSREWGIRMMERHPAMGVVFTDAAIGAYLGREYQRAIDLANAGRALEDSPLAKIVAAQAFGFAGQVDKVRPLLEEAARAETYVCPYETAVGYISVGDIDRAMELLEVAYDRLSNCLVFLRVDPRLAPIREEPYRKAYLGLLARVGLDDEKYNSYQR